jgi:hypothetical protein
MPGNEDDGEHPCDDERIGKPVGGVDASARGPGKRKRHGDDGCRGQDPQDGGGLEERVRQVDRANVG